MRTEMSLIYLVLVLVALSVQQVESRGRAGHRAVGRLQKQEARTPRFSGPDFMLAGTGLASHETELRLFHDGILALETSIPSLGEGGLFIRELTNGRKLLKLIYKDSDHLADCDIQKDKEGLEQFLIKFSGSSRLLKSRYIDGQQIQKDVEAKSLNNSLKLEHSVTPDYQHITRFKAMKKACRKLHFDLKELLNKDKVDEAGRKEHERVKRSYLIYPGTKWCGRGNAADHYGDLGDSRNSDRCCRVHDHCPHTIEGFTNKYGLFNYRFHTVSHCDCDINFRTCLKSVGNEVSDMVGLIYFNTLGTKCFVMKSEKACVQRSWWGKCLKYKNQNTAYIMDPSTY